MVGRRYASQKTSIYFWKTTEQMTFQLRNWLIAWELILESDSWWELNRHLTLVWTWVSLCPSSSPPACLSLPLLSCMVFFWCCGLRSCALFSIFFTRFLQEIIIPVCVGKAFYWILLSFLKTWMSKTARASCFSVN